MAPLRPLSLTFGLEKEGTIGIDPSLQDRPDRSHAARRAFAAQITDLLGERTVYERDRAKWHPARWTVVADTTVCVDTPRATRTSAEIKSPIFGADQLERMPDLLGRIAQSSLTPTNDSGLHLHMGRQRPSKTQSAPAYQPWEPREVVAFMDGFEENKAAIHALVAPHRPAGEYCKPNPTVDADATGWIVRRYEDGRMSRHDALSFLTRLYCPSRYAPEQQAEYSEHYGNRHHAVNLTSLFTKGTIEIKLRQAADAVNATPFMGVMLHMLQAGIDGHRFDWAAHAAATNDKPALSFDYVKPSRPTARPRPAPARGARQG